MQLSFRQLGLFRLIRYAPATYLLSLGKPHYTTVAPPLYAQIVRAGRGDILGLYLLAGQDETVDGLTALPANQVIRLRNVTCAYCGGPYTAGNRRTRDHVIGRNFVPEGTLGANEWNIIVSACERCNHLKSGLEDEISAITLQPELGSRHSDSALAEIAARKARKAKSRLTGKRIQDSNEKLSFSARPMPGVAMTFSMVAPPRLVPDRVYQLAYFHVQGFVYWHSYDEESRRGRFLPGGIVWSADTHRRDWGNGVFVAFANLTLSWQPIILGNAANGNFRIAIRRDPAAQLWSFALEWNSSYRVIGFFGDSSAAERHVNALPQLEMKQLGPGLRFREEVPLKPEDDVLFNFRKA